MKTVAIFDQTDEEIKFILFEGDKSRFNEVYVNAYDDQKALRDELASLLFTVEGEFICQFIEIEEARKEIVNGAKLIVCGVFM